MSIWQNISEVASNVGESLLKFLEKITGLDLGPKDPRKSVAFTIGVIALGAKMAKADGVVTRNEIDAFKEIFTVEPGELQNVARVFNLAKQDVAGFEAYARQIHKLFVDQPDVS